MRISGPLLWSALPLRRAELPSPSRNIVPPVASVASAAAPASPGLVPPANSAPTELTPSQKARDAELVPSAAAFLAAFSNGSAHLTRSGTVVFFSTRDGLAQLYVGDATHPRDPPRRLPTPKERVTGATLTPDEHTVLFASDVNADGNFHIYRVGVDGTGLADLTPAEKMHRDMPRSFGP